MKKFYKALFGSCIAIALFALPTVQAAENSTEEVTRGPLPVEIIPRWIEETLGASSREVIRTREVVVSTEEVSRAEVAVVLPVPVQLIQTGNIITEIFLVVISILGVGVLVQIRRKKRSL